MIYLRALLFQIGFVLSVLIWAPVCIMLFWLPSIPRFRVISQWGRFNVWWCKVTCGLSYRVVGWEHVPQTPCVILAKHQSTWETLCFLYLFPPHAWVLKRELLWIPLFGWAMALSEPIGIAREKRRRALEQVLAQGRERLASGRCVIIFPEGTRMPPGQTGRFQTGGVKLAQSAGCPILPVAHNAGSFWRRREFVKRPGVITVEIGAPIDPRSDSLEAINERVRSWVADTTARLEEGVRAPSHSR